MISDVWIFLGRPGDLPGEAPVSDPARPRLSEKARAWWSVAWPHPSDVFGRDPIVIQITPPGKQAEGTTELASGVAILRGPNPSPSFEPAPPDGFGWLELLVTTAVALMALAIVGGGWARALLDVSTPAAFGLAPAFGAAALIVAGTIVGRTGWPLGSPGGVVVLIVTTGLGWGLLAVRKRSPGGGPARVREHPLSQDLPL
jgi:hypothetical protein